MIEEKKIPTGQNIAEEKSAALLVGNSPLDFFSSPDHRKIQWGTDYFRLTRNQAAVFALLYRALQNKRPDVAQNYLLAHAEIQSDRIDHVFRVKRGGRLVFIPAWGTLIVSRTKGTYRINPPPGLPELSLPIITSNFPKVTQSNTGQREQVR